MDDRFDMYLSEVDRIKATDVQYERLTLVHILLARRCTFGLLDGLAFYPNHDHLFAELFHFVSQNVGEEWKLFIHSLPGWARNRSSTVIDHKSEEERTVPRRIFSCLVQWSFECPESVSVGGIKTALHAVNREDLQLDLDGAEDGRIGADGDGGV